MRFLVDECTGPAVARWLRDKSHDVVSIYDESPGINDEHVLAKTAAENRILITNDKDFGEMVFREGAVHHGVILLRLSDERPATKIAVIEQLLDLYADRLAGQFVVASEQQVRFAAGG